MKKDFNVENLVVAKGNSQLSIGNLIYFTLGNLYVKNETMIKIAEESGLPKELFNGKYHRTYAFMTATQDCLPATSENNQKFKVRLFTNEQEDFIYSRELKVEIKAKQENPMTHLANIYYDSNKEVISYNVNEDLAKQLFNMGYDVKDRIKNTILRFDIIQQGMSRDRLMSKITGYIKNELEASTVSAHGNLYFVPIHKRDKLLELETFFDLLEKEYEKIRAEELKKAKTKINSRKKYYEDLGAHITSLEVLNTEKYVKEYTREYYIDTKKQLDTIKMKLEQLNRKDKISDRVIKGYNEKINKLIERKKKYEEVFNTSLEDLELDFIDLERDIIALEEKNKDDIVQTKMNI
ncbi:MAG: hypothetical protein IJH34_12690 [Romboutsia sp.]|nr:hypothetical protein [Romboutsia sp.]